MYGGCCSVGPDDIAALAKTVDKDLDQPMPNQRRAPVIGYMSSSVM
jgi:hypothetical protein